MSLETLNWNEHTLTSFVLPFFPHNCTWSKFNLIQCEPFHFPLLFKSQHVCALVWKSRLVESNSTQLTAATREASHWKLTADWIPIWFDCTPWACLHCYYPVFHKLALLLVWQWKKSNFEYHSTSNWSRVNYCAEREERELRAIKRFIHIEQILCIIFHLCRCKQIYWKK